MPDPLSHSLRILIVEDQFLIAKQVEMILASAGHEVVGLASSMREALNLAEAARPELVFVDLSLADGVTGATIGQFIIDNYDAEVIFMTANARRLPDDFCGAIGVVGKPFTRHDLSSTMSYLTAQLSDEPSPPPRPKCLQLSPKYAARWDGVAAA